MNRFNSTFQVKPKVIDYPAALQCALAKRKAKETDREHKRPEQPKIVKKQTLRSRPDPKSIAWSKKVRERDGHQCQWPGIKDYLPIAPADFKISIKLAVSPCATGDTRIDAHHIAEKSLRPDLKYSPSNGLALCRTHHEWLPLNRRAAIALKLLSDETYEKAPCAEDCR